MNVRLRTVRDIGNTIRSRRRELGWSQAVLASRAGVSRKWVSEAERGEVVAGVRHLLAVFDALDLTLESRSPGDAPERAADQIDQVDLDAILAEHRNG